ncbi:MAG: hypothetical protein RJA70_3052 [Pseudomonadota bacterium]
MAIDLQALKTERDQIKEKLRDLENEQRRVEGEQKHLRQSEIRLKRTLEAIDTLIEVGTGESAVEAGGATPTPSAQAQH